ncbi:F0F1 ATP synthase subunit B [Nitratireductor mangrovi]|uniref:ATP synthase subunit b n=1 Tax=Nitratireductor mangrovi TaxID=2599600 RepID=A0A5B8KY09_9HYPH|nr:F0F1 ATP synthase subunit B [Nitratireductor mangrovi]QDZ00452.1 F0F1 ATP synthase subunit B [Nitratireductor mangrovi]
MFVATAFAASEEPAQGDTHATTEAGHGGTEAGFPPFETSTFPSQILWLAITFGLFYLFLKRVALPRLAGIIEVRRDRIAQDLDQAARLKQESDEAIAAYEQALAEARQKANEIGQKARDGAKAEADEARRGVEAELDEKLAAAETRIAEIKASAMSDVGTIAEETAGAIVQALGGGSVTKADAGAAVKASR